MEIDQAIRESRDRRLKTKYNNAIYVIQRTFALYKFEEVAFSFNGGKDSTVLLHLLRASCYLNKEESNCVSEDQNRCTLQCPIRTIYFESASAFPEINSFTYQMASIYGLQIEIIRLDFKSGLTALIKEKPIKAIFLGTRIGDPNALGQDQFSPSSTGWPPFMRINPILDWSYRDVWAFLLTCKVQYCSLYDHGYTSIGSICDTVPNSLLSIGDSNESQETFKPAYLLQDGRLERAGRTKKFSPIICDGIQMGPNGENKANFSERSIHTASIIAVGDEILFGKVENPLGSALCRKLHSVGWTVTHLAVVRNDIDAVAEEVEQRKSTNDMVFLYGGVGPLHSDVTVAGVSKAFGVRMAPDEEFEEYLRHLIGEHCIGDRNEMALLPEGITELLHHERLSVPLIKCQNVIILMATNLRELEEEWDCLFELTSSSGPIMPAMPFVSTLLTTSLSDVEAAPLLEKISIDFPDLYIGCYRESRVKPLLIEIVGKDLARVQLAGKYICQKFHPSFSEVKQS